MSATLAMKQIKQGQPLPVYVCWGRESYLMNEFIQYLQKQLVAEELRDFAVSKYNLQEVPLADVLEDAQTAPFLAERKVIIAEGAFFFTAARNQSKVEHDLEGLAAYLKEPADHTVLVFLVEADKLDERKKVVKTLKDRNALISFQPLGAGELNGWVMARAKAIGFSLENAAVDYLVLNTGANLQQLNAELVKLAAYAGHGGVIKLEDAEMLVVRSVEQNVFAMIDEVVRLQMDKALSMLYELLKQREEPIKIIALIARQFRIILQVKALAEQGYSQHQMASKLGLHPYAVRIAEQQGRSLNASKLATVLDQLADLDYRMKTGRVDKVLGLELFLLRLNAS